MESLNKRRKDVSVNYFDLLQILFSGLGIYLCYLFYTKKMYKSIVAVVILVISVWFTSPVVLEVPSNSRFSSQPKTIPEKVVVEEKTFEEKQAEKFEKLKQESKNVEENINE